MRHNTRIGKNILEMFMFSLYPEAKTIYREYLQNACDSINEAVRQGVLNSRSDGHVTVTISQYNQSITITDNGIGIKANEAEETLKDIAKSGKNENNAGFYGIGRLVGAGYCQKLTFKTSFKGEPVASELTFDVNQIRDILADTNDDSDAGDVVDHVTTFSNAITEDVDNHYFVVILSGILGDYVELLDEKVIGQYITQIAPINYAPTFINNLIKPNITIDGNTKYLNYYNKLNFIRVSLNNIVDMRKAYDLYFEGTNIVVGTEHGDPISKLHFFTINDPIEGDLAWGWYACTPSATQIKEIDPITGKDVLTRGIRLRCHNIQVGDENVLNSCFKQARSHVYFNGEVHTLHKDIRPDTDRSNLAPTRVAVIFRECLSKFFRNELEKLYQDTSKAKKLTEAIEGANKELVEITAKPVSEEFPEESKQARLAEALTKRQTAEVEFQKLSNSRTRESESHKDMMRAFQSRITNAHNRAPANITMPVLPTISEEIERLANYYGEERIDMLKQIFSIIDRRFSSDRKYETKLIKQGVIHDLKVNSQ